MNGWCLISPCSTQSRDSCEIAMNSNLLIHVLKHKISSLIVRSLPSNITIYSCLVYSILFYSICTDSCLFTQNQCFPFIKGRVWNFKQPCSFGIRLWFGGKYNCFFFFPALSKLKLCCRQKIYFQLKCTTFKFVTIFLCVVRRDCFLLLSGSFMFRFWQHPTTLI